MLSEAKVKLDRSLIHDYPEMWTLEQKNEFFSKMVGCFKISRLLYYIFNEKSKLPTMTAARLLRYVAFLKVFHYTVRTQKIRGIYKCRFPPRAPLKCVDEESNSVKTDELNFRVINQISSMLVNFWTLAKETQEDVELKKLKELLIGKNVDHEYNLQNGIIFRRLRVLILKKLHSEILKDLHHTTFKLVRWKH